MPVRPNFDVRFWRQMTTKVKNFRFIDRIPNYVSWPSNLVKIGRCEVPERSRGLPNKKIGLSGTRPSAQFFQNEPIAPKIPWTLSPLDLSTYNLPNLVRIGCVLPELFRKNWFFGPKSQYNNIGFQPTKIRQLSIVYNHRTLRHVMTKNDLFPKNCIFIFWVNRPTQNLTG